MIHILYLVDQFQNKFIANTRAYSVSCSVQYYKIKCVVLIVSIICYATCRLIPFLSSVLFFSHFKKHVVLIISSHFCKKALLHITFQAYLGKLLMCLLIQNPDSIVELRILECYRCEYRLMHAEIYLVNV